MTPEPTADHHQHMVPPTASEGTDYRIDNPMPHRLPEGENATPLEVTGTTASEKLVIIMVGLPATGTLLEVCRNRHSVVVMVALSSKRMNQIS